MTPEQKEKLICLKVIQQQKIMKSKISKAKKQISNNIDNFNLKYRFADCDEAMRISQILKSVSYLHDKTADYSSLAVSASAYYQNVWICFLTGSEEILDIFVLGNLSDFLADCDDWDFISSDIVLVNEDISGIVTYNNGKLQVKDYET